MLTEAHLGGVSQLATTILPDGLAIAITGGNDGTIRLWDLQAGTPKTDNLPAHQAYDPLEFGGGGVEQLVVTTLPDGRAMAITAGGEHVCTYDLSAGRIWRRINVGSYVQSVELTSDGLIVVGAQMGLLGLRDALPEGE